MYTPLVHMGNFYCLFSLLCNCRNKRVFLLSVCKSNSGAFPTAWERLLQSYCGARTLKHQLSQAASFKYR